MTQILRRFHGTALECPREHKRHRLLGLELDLHSICRSGRKAFCIAAVGTSLPFICGILVFMGVALSITVLPVLARTLAGLKLLTTRIGEVAMAAVAFNDLWTCGLRQSLDPAIDPSRQVKSWPANLNLCSSTNFLVKASN
ncbi:Cation/H(+) antiporter 17 [Glycine max]|nr:Cation/H(+) antiporter 17 [Glycine max]